MKKITFFLTTAFFMASNLSPAAADSYNYTPYIGIDYTYNNATALHFKPNYNVAGLHIGSDYGRYFGTELFFNQSNSDKRHIEDTSIKTSYRSYGLDLMAYLPIVNHFTLLATTGAGEYVYKITVAPQKHRRESGFGYRVGGGFKCAINENWGFRAIARYVNYDKIDIYKHSMEYSASIEYHF
ncbi:MAG: porin family protein [Alphaproteobacteria bacterium]|nr:porin family protein [Alphaproteobacteria bacterium]